ncbi:DUF350 domain-containing protein [Phragmitibacter flavus]|uniref:DUF350 domain-containing protein n=1 Tax=Phragmitibacter flavus TaxID=2576071 RepID=A0A5R8KG05_9BACT|nr:DUF350 domain-containing protein [Phragmitibacter flavus]TLD71237.1 DUF350 domain-containing protein [Phragmitibacter flavus]
MDIINWTDFVNSLIYSCLGVVVFAVCFALVDWLTPHDLVKEIVEHKNMALAIVVGAVALGISIIVAAAVHG